MVQKPADLQAIQDMVGEALNAAFKAIPPETVRKVG
jgi:DNA-binding protein YbaB